MFSTVASRQRIVEPSRAVTVVGLPTFRAVHLGGGGLGIVHAGNQTDHDQHDRSSV
jgi:hypothetical protein